MAFDTLCETILEKNRKQVINERSLEYGQYDPKQLLVIMDDCCSSSNYDPIDPLTMPIDWDTSFKSLYRSLSQHSKKIFEKIFQKGRHYDFSLPWFGYGGFGFPNHITRAPEPEPEPEPTWREMYFPNYPSNFYLVNVILAKESFMTDDGPSVKHVLVLYFALFYEKCFSNNYTKFNMLNEMHPEIRQLLCAFLQDLLDKEDSSQKLRQIVEQEIEYVKDPAKLTVLEFVKFMFHVEEQHKQKRIKSEQENNAALDRLAEEHNYFQYLFELVDRQMNKL